MRKTEKTGNEKKKTLIALGAAATLILALLAAYITLRPQTAAGAKTLSVRIQHLQSEEQTLSVRTEAEYLREALEPEGIIAGTESTYGLWVETVDGETADEARQQWWGYTVNGETAQYGVDEQPVADGDVIEFTLYEGY